MAQQRRNRAGADRSYGEGLHQYLMRLMNHFESYHQSKENMSWLATTIYLAGLIALTSVMSSNGMSAALTGNPWIRAGFISLALLALVSVVLFLRQQTSDRHVAARFVSTCGTLLSRLLSIEIRDADLAEDRYCTNGGEHVVPAILASQLRESEGRGRKLDWYVWSPVLVMVLLTIGFVTLAVFL